MEEASGGYGREAGPLFRGTVAEELGTLHGGSGGHGKGGREAGMGAATGASGAEEAGMGAATSAEEAGTRAASSGEDGRGRDVGGRHRGLMGWTIRTGTKG